MGAYDDLLPQQEGQQPAGGAYGDLIPEEAPSEPSFGQQAKRAAGLSARQVGPRAAAAAAGAAMGAPLAGVGAIPGALAGLTAFELVNLLDKVAGTNFLEKALTAAGLPTAETDTEKLVEGTTEAMSGMGGMTAGAKTVLRTAKGPVTRGLAEDLTQAPVMGQIAAGAAGAAGEATRQSGGDPVEQLLASGGAAAVAPVGTSLAQGVAKVGKNTIQDIIAAIRASGSNPNPEAVRRLESQAIDTLAKGQEGEVAAALRGAHPEFAGHPAVRATMKDVMKELQMGMDKEGYIDPHRLYSIRQTLNETMTKEAAKAGMSPNHEVARKALKLVKTNLDNAMVGAGAAGWKEYLQMFSKGMAKVEAHEARATAMNKIVGETATTTPGELVRGELPHIPTLLHRPTMFANFMLRLVSEGATEPVARQLALDMTDPKKFRALLLRPKGQPIRVEMNKVLMQAAILSSLVKKHQKDNPSEPE